MRRTSLRSGTKLEQLAEAGVVQAHLRAAAQHDVEEAVAYYRDEAGTDVALDFVDSFEAAIGSLCDHPLTGSLRFAFELEIPDLRSWSVQRFPYLVFYVPDDETIDVWRVLHNRRDIPAFLTADPRT
jgi:toxin ParE1/3/4